MQAPTATTRETRPSQADVAWTVDALRVVWERQHERVNGRIELVERAVAALAEDRLDDNLRADAGRAAHMLAGSLGMFGFVDASDAARELEAELARPAPERAHVSSALLRRLRDGIQGPVALCTDDALARAVCS
jgi:HPt (histidine-containing phosphotransfer) domain-containing protein